MPVLAYKPHAATHAAVVRQLPEVYQKIRLRMMDQRPDGYKDFVAILLLHKVFSSQDILSAIEEIGADLVTAELIRAHLLRIKSPISAVAVPDELQHYRLEKQQITKYDSLARGMVH